MRFSKTLAAILLCATTLTLTPAAAAASRPSQKTRASKAQAPAPQTEITKEKIDAIVKAVHQAAKEKNVDGIIAHLAPDMKFTSRSAGRPVVQANRAQYAASIKLMFEHTLEYTALIKSVTITIAPDGQSATAQSEIFEMTTLTQGTVAANVIGTTIFKIYKGKILIASMDGTITYV